MYACFGEGIQQQGRLQVGGSATLGIPMQSIIEAYQADRAQHEF